LLSLNFVTYKCLNYKLCYLTLKKLASKTCQDRATLSNWYVCTVQYTVYMYISVLCTNLPQILRLLFCLLIYIHLNTLWTQSTGRKQEMPTTHSAVLQILFFTYCLLYMAFKQFRTFGVSSQCLPCCARFCQICLSFKFFLSHSSGFTVIKEFNRDASDGSCLTMIMFMNSKGYHAVSHSWNRSSFFSLFKTFWRLLNTNSKCKSS
jgi:hypothetical protein